MKRKNLLSVLFVSVSLISCASFNSHRNLASTNEELTVEEQQILSKNAVFKLVSSNKKNQSLVDDYQLSDTESQALPTITRKLNRILSTPIVNNSSRQLPLMNQGMDRSSDKKEVRITSWNIERGQNFDKISEFLSVSNEGRCDRDRARKMLNGQNEKRNNKALDEVCALSESDIFIFNEADLGICRSGYRAVAGDLATQLDMNYAFAPSFFEAEPSKVGLEKNADSYCKQENVQLSKNLTGNALLSRYPLSRIRVIPLPVGYLTKDGEPATKDNNDTYCYDWHDDEIKGPSLVDKGVRLGAKYLFNETITRELRYGSRNALVADVQLPTGMITVVATHLENKAKPSCRQAQMRYLMNHVDTTYPLVIGGDMNTTGSNGGRMGLKTTIWETSLSQTVKSQNFWLNLFGWSNPVTAIFGYGKQAFQKLTTTQNPTRVDIKWLRDNPEGVLFLYLKNKGFIWKGDARFSLSGKDEGPWSTTNARDKIGFVGTHYLNRTYGTEGVSKLDWLFVNPQGNPCVQSKYPRTLGALRQQTGDDFPSDHVPITLLLDLACY